MHRMAAAETEESDGYSPGQTQRRGAARYGGGIGRKGNVMGCEHNRNWQLPQTLDSDAGPPNVLGGDAFSAASAAGAGR